jgi:hypothetical protein
MTQIEVIRTDLLRPNHALRTIEEISQRPDAIASKERIERLNASPKARAAAEARAVALLKALTKRP